MKPDERGLTVTCCDAVPPAVDAVTVPPTAIVPDQDRVPAGPVTSWPPPENDQPVI
jgi:hypothetical protein